MVSALGRRTGLTLLEVVLSSALLAMVASVAFVANVTGMRISSSSLSAAGGVERGRTAIGRILQQVRQSESVEEYDSTPGTLVCTSAAGDMCFYLYNEDEQWPNPGYDLDGYQLRSAWLSGGVLTYGDGEVLGGDLLPPPSGTVFSLGDVVTVTLVIDAQGSGLSLRGAAVPRNAP